MIFAVVYAKDAAEDIDAAFNWLAARAPAAAVDLLREQSIEPKSTSVGIPRSIASSEVHVRAIFVASI
jgi:plasmid stabilization system protein ParE